MHEIKIVEKVHIKNLEKNSAQLDEGFRSYGHLNIHVERSGSEDLGSSYLKV